MVNLSHLHRVLAVEDEALILLDLEQTLADAGVRDVVGVTGVEDALAAIEGSAIDAAMLDLHLGRGGWSYAVARRLKEKGIPFIFSSGSADVVEGFSEVPLLMKPFSAEQLISALTQVTAEAGAVAAR